MPGVHGGERAGWWDRLMQKFKYGMAIGEGTNKRGQRPNLHLPQRHQAGHLG